MARKLSNDEISQGELEISARLIDASNATLFGKIVLEDPKDEVSVAVVYKPILGERPLWDFPDGNLASREVAAYQVSDFAGLHLVPTTVLRDGPFGIGAVQQWIEVPEDYDPIEFGQSSDSRLRLMALFDCIVNNTDRKFGHILLDAEGNLFGCDHGVTFHQEDKLRTVLWQFAGGEFSQVEQRVLLDLRDDFQELRIRLTPLLSEGEIDSLLLRINRLLEEGVFPYPSPQWPAVPWPPV